MHKYKGIADSHAVRAAANRIADGGAVERVHPNGGNASRIRVFLPTLVAIILAGALGWALHALVYQNSEERDGIIQEQKQLIEQWERLAEREARDRKELNELGRRAVTTMRSYVSRAASAIESGELSDATIVLGGIGEMLQSSEFLTDQELIDEYVEAVKQLLKSLGTKD